MNDVNQALAKIGSELQQWWEAGLRSLPNLLLALLVVGAAVLAARWVAKLVRKSMLTISDNRQLVGLASSMARVATIGVGAVIALGILQLQGTVASLLAGVGVLGLALGFAFQDMAANFIAGIILAIRSPYRINDVVQIGDFFGVIKELGLRSTTGETFDGQLVYMPNKEMLSQHLINFSQTGVRRINLAVGVSYGDDLDKAERVAKAAIESLEERVADREVQVFFDGFGDSSINFTARFWISVTEHNFLKAQGDAIKAIKAAFDAEDISIPFPIRTLDFGEAGGVTLQQAAPALNGGGQSNQQAA